MTHVNKIKKKEEKIKMEKMVDGAATTEINIVVTVKTMCTSEMYEMHIISPQLVFDHRLIARTYLERFSA